jgi:hypothetical protein
MRLEGIAVGDIVLVERKGRMFHAEVEGKSNGKGELALGELAIRPLERGITYRTAGARDIVTHWRRKVPCATPRARSRPRPEPAFATLEGVV